VCVRCFCSEFVSPVIGITFAVLIFYLTGMGGNGYGNGSEFSI